MVSGRTLGSMPMLVRTLGQVKVATARANRDAGVLDADVARAIEVAAEPLIDGTFDPAEFPGDLLAGGGSIVVHLNINERLARAAGVEDAELAASQSTADVCHTAHRLAVLDAGDRLIVAASQTIAELRTVADRFEAIPTLARTCLRDAMATPLSTVFAGAADALERRGAALGTAMEPLHEVVLGSTVIGRGEGAPASYRAAVVDHLTDVTGLALVAHPSPASALQHGDDLAAVSSAVVHLSQPLLKLATDLRLLGSGRHSLPAAARPIGREFEAYVTLSVTMVNTTVTRNFVILRCELCSDRHCRA